MLVIISKATIIVDRNVSENLENTRWILNSWDVKYDRVHHVDQMINRKNEVYP